MAAKDNRRFPRIPAANVTLVTPATGERGEEGFARTHTVGAGGCGFVSDHRFDPGSVLEMRIAVNGSILTATARVVYSRPMEGGRSEIGVEFLQLADDDRELLDRLIAQQTDQA